MKKVFWENPYQIRLETRVVDVQADEVLFESTIAYSFAGGQESDKVWIDGIEVLASRMDGSLIWYRLPSTHGLSVSQAVVMTIDWPRRHKLMRLHFAAELILEIVTQQYGYEKVGAHISEHKSRIDFLADTNVSEKFTEILERYNEIIEKKLAIEKGYSDVKTQRRYWKIDGFAQVPCGGTHVGNTGEVGFVTLKRERPGRGIERIEIRLVNP